jgi:homoserine O-acetyltransferase/O-succinyltransferase
MSANTYYTQELHGPFETHDIGDLALEEGGTLHGCKLAYTTFGKLNAAKDNAILVPTWYSGTTKIMEQIYIGAGHALDPAKYFIVSISQIGSGTSSSPHNTPAPFNGPKFPKVRIGDDVRAQHKLLTEKFGITQLALVFGGSMGAQQTYEWALRYPDMVKRAAPLAGTAKNTPHTFMMGEVVKDILSSDPAFKGGFYADSNHLHLALRKHAAFFTVIGWCHEFLHDETWRGLGFTSLDDFVTGFMEAYFLPMDPNNLLAMVWKWQRGDVSRHTGGDLAAALGRIKAKVTVMPIETDLIFPPAACEAEAKMIPGANFQVIKSRCGHLGLFAIEPGFMEQIDKHLRELLATPA